MDACQVFDGMPQRDNSGGNLNFEEHFPKLSPIRFGKKQELISKVKIDKKEDQPLSFAAIISAAPKNFDLGPPVKIREPTYERGVPVVSFTNQEIVLLQKPFERCIIAKFSRVRADLDLFRNWVKQKNSLKEEISVYALDSRHILINFESEEEFLKVYSLGDVRWKEEWVTLLRWSPFFRPNLRSTEFPVTVGIPGLNVHLHNEGVLQSIAKALGGRFLTIVENGLMNYVRFRMEIDLLKERDEWIIIQNGEQRFSQRIIYENIPPFCDHCCLKGHFKSKCRELNRPRADVQPKLKRMWVEKEKGMDLKENIDAVNNEKIEAKKGDLSSSANLEKIINKAKERGKEVMEVLEVSEDEDEERLRYRNKVGDLIISSWPKEKMKENEDSGAEPSKKAEKSAAHLLNCVFPNAAESLIKDLADDDTENLHVDAEIAANTPMAKGTALLVESLIKDSVAATNIPLVGNEKRNVTTVADTPKATDQKPRSLAVADTPKAEKEKEKEIEKKVEVPNKERSDNKNCKPRAEIRVEKGKSAADLSAIKTKDGHTNSFTGAFSVSDAKGVREKLKNSLLQTVNSKEGSSFPKTVAAAHSPVNLSDKLAEVSVAEKNKGLKSAVCSVEKISKAEKIKPTSLGLLHWTLTLNNSWFKPDASWETGIQLSKIQKHEVDWGDANKSGLLAMRGTKRELFSHCTRVLHYEKYRRQVGKALAVKMKENFEWQGAFSMLKDNEEEEAEFGYVEDDTSFSDIEVCEMRKRNKRYNRDMVLKDAPRRTHEDLWIGEDWRLRWKKDIYKDDLYTGVLCNSWDENELHDFHKRLRRGDKHKAILMKKELDLKAYLKDAKKKTRKKPQEKYQNYFKFTDVSGFSPKNPSTPRPFGWTVVKK